MRDAERKRCWNPTTDHETRGWLTLFCLREDLKQENECALKGEKKVPAETNK